MINLKQIGDHKCFGGEQLQYSHDSTSLNCQMRFSIFLPSNSSTAKVPLLYWLSGLTCSDENFVQKAGAQRYAEQNGVAIIAPDTSPRGESVPDDPEGSYDMGLGAGFYLNATREPWAEHYQMYSYIAHELPALVNANFPIDVDKCSIFGHSMGGHGALTIALKNPGNYRSMSAFAPISSPIRCPWGRKALGNYLGDNMAVWHDYDTTELIGKAQERIPLLVDQGSADQFLQEQLQPELLNQACESAGYPLQLRLQEGYDHSYFFIASFIEDHVNFHARALA